MQVVVLGNTPLARALRADLPAPAGAADVLWVADSREYVRPRPGQLVILSWPNPVGTCARFERATYDQSVKYAVVTENIRVRDETFTGQPFLAVGTRDGMVPRAGEFTNLLSRFTNRILWMSPESAEMVKCALNSFLATQVEFGNRLGPICERVGADVMDVVRALRADPRIGDGYLMPGGEPGPHLVREVERMAAL